MPDARPAGVPREAVVEERVQSEGSPLDVLPWDSEFFGVRIARCEPAPGTLASVIAEARAGAIDCVYLTVDGEHHELVEEAIRRGARLVEFRLRAHRFRRRETGERDPAVRLAGPEDRPRLLELARELSGMSRFAADPRFPPDRVARMYELQMERCLETGVVVVPADGARGVCAVSVEGGEAYIQVAYTDPTDRHRALGYALILTALESVDARRVFAAAKASNMGVIRTSLTLGFRIFEFKVLLHLWLDELVEPAQTPASPPLHAQGQEQTAKSES
jgi:ribosomal protein S18 acetylase RimI-like enzyme